MMLPFLSSLLIDGATSFEGELVLHIMCLLTHKTHLAAAVTEPVL